MNNQLSKVNKSAEARGLMLTPQIDTHSEAVQCMTLYFGNSVMSECVSELHKIETTERLHTIEALRERGEHVETCTKLVSALGKYNISCNLMTVDEARQVLSYARNATPEIKAQKVEHVRELIYKVINGVHDRRDYRLDPVKARILETLLDKHQRYEDGEIDMSRKFDVSLYPKQGCDYLSLFGEYPSVMSSRDRFDDYDVREDYDDEDYDGFNAEEYLGGDEAEIRNMFESMTDEELLDGGYIDEEDFFVYGPYTVNDIRNISVLTYETWASVTDKRKTARLESILSEILDGRGDSVETDLIRHYVGKVVISARRMSARNLTRMAVSLGRQCVSEIDNAVNLTERMEQNFGLIKQKLYWCSYYLSRICGYNKDSLVKQFGQARPISAEFFTAVGEKVDTWTDAYTDSVENGFDSYLLKLDDHMFELESYYKNVLREKNRAGNKSTNDSVGLLAAGGLLG